MFFYLERENFNRQAVELPHPGLQAAVFVIGIFELHAHHIGIEPFVRTFLVFAAFFVEYGARLRGKDGMLRQKLAQQRMQVALMESGFLRLGGRRQDGGVFRQRQSFQAA